MLDDEGGLAEPRLLEVLPLLALVVQLLHPRLVRPLWEDAHMTSIWGGGGPKKQEDAWILYRVTLHVVLNLPLRH